MPSSTTLPAPLRPWASALSLLDIEIATALGPMIGQLDQLIGRHELGIGSHGELDGYNGITHRGDPAGLVMSEWAIADAAPLEFLRRATSSELLYLQPAYQQDQPTGRSAVLVDTGTGQLGAARLVQLATLIVLQRRVLARGRQLLIGILGDEPGRWLSGETASLMNGWLAGRTADDPEPDDVREWTASMTPADEIWVLAGPRLAGGLPGRLRTLVSRETAWDERGPTAVTATLAGTEIELALPRPDLAVRALRTAAFRSQPPPQAQTPASGPVTIRMPFFPTATERFLARGATEHELVLGWLPAPGGVAKSPRIHTFGGSLMAATLYKRRVVALVLIQGRLRIQVVGNPIGRLAEIDAPASEVELAENLITAALGRLDKITIASPEQLVWEREDDRVVLLGTTAHVLAADPIVTTRGGIMAARSDHNHWVVGRRKASIEVEPSQRVIGLVITDDSRPELITWSTADRTVRLVSELRTRDVPAASGSRIPPSAHPAFPWLLVTRDNDRIEVVHLPDGKILHTMQSGP